MGKSQAKSHYAVFIGHRPGIYHSWADTKVQVEGFHGSRFKGFHSRTQAQEWLDEHSAQPGALQAHTAPVAAPAFWTHQPAVPPIAVLVPVPESTPSQPEKFDYDYRLWSRLPIPPGTSYEDAPRVADAPPTVVFTSGPMPDPKTAPTPTFVQIADLLKRELNLADQPPARLVAKACVTLGVATQGLTLIKQAARCYALLNLPWLAFERELGSEEASAAVSRLASEDASAAMSRLGSEDAPAAVSRRSAVAAASPIDASNQGYTLLRSYGWKPGRGVGLEEAGIVEPIGIDAQARTSGNRACLGTPPAADVNSLDGQQSQALELVLDGESIFLTGGAGTGKSFAAQALPTPPPTSQPASPPACLPA